MTDDPAATASNDFQRPKSLTQVVLEHIRTSIIDGEFRLGDAVSEKVVAAALGISKTPVREAFLQLKAEGLIAVVPQSGTFVFAPSALEVQDVCELREVLELAALNFACQRSRPALVTALRVVVDRMGQAQAADDLKAYRRLDGEFHRALFDHCGNQALANAYASIAFKIQALRPRLSVDQDRIDASYHEHVAMLDLVSRDEIKRCRALLARHIGKTRRSYLAIIAGNPVVR